MIFSRFPENLLKPPEWYCSKPVLNNTALTQTFKGEKQMKRDLATDSHVSMIVFIGD